MQYILLLAIIVCITLQTVGQKHYNIKTSDRGIFAYGSLTALGAALVFLISSGFDLHFSPEILPYSIAFGISYGVSMVFIVLAFRHGPVALTNLINDYSLIIPTFYGIIFLGDVPSIYFWAGLALLMISLFFVNFRKKGEDPVSLRWIIFAAFTFVGNGMCSTVQTVFVKSLGEDLKNEFMILALGIFFAIMTVLSLIFERDVHKEVLRRGSVYAFGSGVFNGGLNLLVILLVASGLINVSVMFPIISAGGMIAAFLLSMLVYKEKMTSLQKVGFFIGVGAVILLNL